MSVYLGILLKQARSLKSLTQEQTAEAVHVSPSLVAKFEAGQRIPHPETARGLDELLGTGDLIQQMAVESRRDVQPRWLRPWTELERDAVTLRCYQPGIIPGLLQTEVYARTALASGLLMGANVDVHVTNRLARQAVLDGADPPLATFVIDEAALRRGDPGVMKEQLLHLVEMGERSRVLIQVVPETTGIYVGQSGPFTVAALSRGQHVGFLEDQLHGRVVADHRELAALERAWDAVRAVALPCDQSRDLILKRVNQL